MCINRPSCQHHDPILAWHTHGGSSHGFRGWGCGTRRAPTPPVQVSICLASSPDLADLHAALVLWCLFFSIRFVLWLLWRQTPTTVAVTILTSVHCTGHGDRFVDTDTVVFPPSTATPIPKRIRWFVDNGHAVNDTDNLNFLFDTHADLVDGVYPCCGFASVPQNDVPIGRPLLSVSDEGNHSDPARRAAADRFFARMRAAGKPVIVAINGMTFPRVAYEQRTQLASEVVAVRVRACLRTYVCMRVCVCVFACMRACVRIPSH